MKHSNHPPKKNSSPPPQPVNAAALDQLMADMAAQMATLQQRYEQLTAQKEQVDALETKKRATRRFNFPQYNSADPEIAGEYRARKLPTNSYGKTEELQANILALVGELGAARGRDLMNELNLTRSNADFHLQKLAAAGKLYVMLEPDHGQTRLVATRDLDTLKNLIAESHEVHGPADPHGERREASRRVRRDAARQRPPRA